MQGSFSVLEGSYESYQDFFDTSENLYCVYSNKKERKSQDKNNIALEYIKKRERIGALIYFFAKSRYLLSS